MLLVLRSKLWRHGTAASITGSGATTQVQQTNAGSARWYSALTHKTVYLGTTIKKLIESDEPFLIPSIEGEGASQQTRQYSDGLAEVAFIASGATLQAQQIAAGLAYVINPVTGTGATYQESGWSTATAEHVDVELEAIAAILAAI